MAKKAKKHKAVRAKSEPSMIIQAGIVFVVIGAIILVAYVFKNFT